EAHLQRALSLAVAAEDMAAQGEIQQHLGDLALRLGNNVQACDYFETAVSLAQQTNNVTLEGRAAEGLGYALIQHSRPLSEVVPHFEKAIALHRQSDNPLDEARALVNYFTVLQNVGAWDRALHMADRAIAAQQAIHYRRGEAIAYQTYGIVTMQLGDFVQAGDCLQRALMGFEEVGEPLGATIARMSLGTVAERQGEQTQAAVFYEAALADAQQLGAAMFVAFVQQSWGSMLVEMEEWETAVPLLQSAVQIWIDQSDRNFQLRCEALLGLAYMGVGNDEQAAELARAGWVAFQELDTIHGEERELWLWALAQLCRRCGMEEETAVLVRAAYNELQKHARVIADPDISRRFFVQVPSNRAIVQAYDSQEKIERTQQVWLAHKDAPLGRTLTPDEMVAVQWTLPAPEDEAILNKTERRRIQLKRLLTEAAAQNAVPTDDDLAAALTVSRRTILRDMQALAAAGAVWQTRGRG
ncbi:MAG: DUF1670 domain-containing protein, partial [Anaerolineales bacterium]|nr:DUF1670 domain-containing protein [Anaerolineales bacterium]